MAENNDNNEQTDIIGGEKTESEMPLESENVKETGILDEAETIDIESEKRAVNKEKSSDVLYDQPNEILTLNSLDNKVIKEVIREEIGEFWETLELKLRNLLHERSEQSYVDIHHIICQSATEMDQKLKLHYEGVLSISEKVNKSLNGLISSLLDRIEDPKGQFAFNLQKPLLKGLLNIYDLLQDLEKNDENSLYNEEQRTNYHTIRTQMLQVFHVNDIMPITPESGTKIDPKYHRIIEVVPTDQPEEDNCISHCIRDGFQYGSLILRPADVAIGKYSEEPKTVNESEVTK